MKMLIVSALVCAMMVLTRAASPPRGSIQDETERRLVKRSTDCSSDWSYLGGRCYHYVPTHMTWAGAERNCQSLGGNLASVHNSQQYFDIQKLILENEIRPSKAWIGGTDAQEESQWFWSDGTPFRYRQWCRGEPDNNKGNQHCMQMNYSALVEGLELGGPSSRKPTSSIIPAETYRGSRVTSAVLTADVSNMRLQNHKQMGDVTVATSIPSTVHGKK